MANDIRKTEASKRRIRRNLAAKTAPDAAFGDKIRLVEEMAKEKIPKQTKGPEPPKSAADQKSKLLTAVEDTIQNRPRGQQVIKHSDDQNKLDGEVEELFADPTRGASILAALFPQGIPTDLTFFDRLIDFQMRLGWGESVYRVTGLLLSLAVEQVPPPKGEALLRALPQTRNPFFFQLLDSLGVLLNRREIRAEFAAEWFPLLLRRIGNDLASGGFWKALEVYCERYPKNALELLRILAQGNEEQQISVAAYILGSLRRADLDQEAAAHLAQFDTELSSSSRSAIRSIYQRSWLRTAWRGKVHAADFESLTARMLAGTNEEQEQAFWLICRSLLNSNIPEDASEFGWKWLRSQVSPHISAGAKYQVVDFAAHLPAQKAEQAANLILAAQPISDEHKGTWKQVEHFLVKVLETNLELFRHFIIGLAERSGETWLKILKQPRQFEWLLSEMQTRDVSSAIGELIFSERPDSRQIGLFFFDELKLTAVPAEVFEKVGEKRVALAFYEAQRSVVRGPAIARFLILLLSVMKQSSQALQDEFYNEIVLQLKNYPGGCKEQFELRAAEFPVLKKAITEVEAYFRALEDARKSSINKIGIPGFARSARIRSRRMANEVSKGAEELSIFTKLLKKVVLLYGREWRTYHDGTLGDSSDLKVMSTSTEFPRMEFVDPEGMQLRRFHASVRINELSALKQLE